MPKTRNGELVTTADGAVEREAVEKPPLGLSLLVEIITLYNKLNKHDDAKFKESSGHPRVAVKATRKLGEAAQREEWSKAELKKRVNATLRAYLETKQKKDRQAKKPLRDLVKRWESEVERAANENLSPEEWQEAYQSLRKLAVRFQNHGENSAPQTAPQPEKARETPVARVGVEKRAVSSGASKS